MCKPSCTAFLFLLLADFREMSSQHRCSGYNNQVRKLSITLALYEELEQKYYIEKFGTLQ